MIKIAIADDHPLILDGLKNLIEEQENLVLVGWASNGSEMLVLCDEKEMDVILMDVDMPVMGGLEAAGIIHNRFPDRKIIILSMHDEKAIIQKASNAGASGYLLKNVAGNELALAIKKVFEGGTYFSPEVTLALLQNEVKTEDVAGSGTDLEILTEREKEIIRFVVDGYSNKEIADKLFISYRTVDTHRSNIMKKLDVKNVAGLIKYAIRKGLMSD